MSELLDEVLEARKQREPFIQNDIDVCLAVLEDPATSYVSTPYAEVGDYFKTNGFRVEAMTGVRGEERWWIYPEKGE